MYTAWYTYTSYSVVVSVYMHHKSHESKDHLIFKNTQVTIKQLQQNKLGLNTYTSGVHLRERAVWLQTQHTIARWNQQ